MPEKTSKQEHEQENRLSELLGPQALELLEGTGLNLIQQVDMESSLKNLSSVRCSVF